MSGARFNVISSRRSPLHKFVIQKIEKAAPEATRSPAAEPPSATHQPAIEAVAPSLTLPAPRVGRWLARIVGRKAEVIPSSCSQGDVVVIPGGTEHEAWFREDTEVIDFFAPPRAEFLLGGKPNYVSEDSQTSNQSGADE
jgi:hypothetical protein